MAVLLGSAIAKSQTAADAPPPPPSHSHEYGMGHRHVLSRMGFFSKALNLTDDQKAQMKTIMQKEHPRNEAAVPAATPDRPAASPVCEGPDHEVEGTRPGGPEITSSRPQPTVAQTRIHNQMYQLLTPDQQSKLKEMEANHQARMQQHMHQAPPAPPEQ